MTVKLGEGRTSRTEVRKRPKGWVSGWIGAWVRRDTIYRSRMVLGNGRARWRGLGNQVL